jgi:hypothetical protein
MLRLAVGDRFPPVALPTLDGTLEALSHAWTGGPALFAIGHADCATTRLALPYVDRIHRRRGAGAGVLAILQEDAEGARHLAEDLELALPMVLDREPYLLGDQLGLETVPTLIHVDAHGTVAGLSEGFRRDDLQAFAARLGVTPPLFDPTDTTPPLRPR